jgi:DNA mismatch repair ATPase MutS
MGLPESLGFAKILTSFGLSALDCSTGKTFVSEINSSSTYILKSFHETYRFLLSLEARTVLCHINIELPPNSSIKIHDVGGDIRKGNMVSGTRDSTGGDFFSDFITFVTTQLQLNNYETILEINQVGTSGKYKKFRDADYQNTLFSKAFRDSKTPKKTPDVSEAENTTKSDSEDLEDSEKSEEELENSSSGEENSKKDSKKKSKRETKRETRKSPGKDTKKKSKKKSKRETRKSLGKNSKKKSKRETKISPKKKKLLRRNLIHELELEHSPAAAISLCVLLQYCYEKNESLLSNISLPETKWLDNKYHLNLTHNAISQLYLLPTSGEKSKLAIYQESLFRKKNNRVQKPTSVLEVLDFTSTAMGKRFLYEMLTNPILDITELQSRYDFIDFFQNNPKIARRIREIMIKFPDLERYIRRIPANY